MSNKSNKRPKRGRGRPKFQPTDEHRRFVALMAGFKLTWPEIAKVLGISKTTLRLRFKAELANGSALLKATTISRFYTALDEGAPWAISMAMRNRLAWDRTGIGGAIAAPDADEGPLPKVEVTFHIPGHGDGRAPDPPLTPDRPIPGQLALPRPTHIDTPFGRVPWDDDHPRPAGPRTELDAPQRHQGGGESRLFRPPGRGTDWMGS
jgi:hypothetical protein